MRPPPGEAAGQSSRVVMAKHKAANGVHSVSKSEDWSPAGGTGKAKRVDWGAYSERAGKGTPPPESTARGAPGHNPFDDDRRTSSTENDDPTVLQSDWFKLLTPQVRPWVGTPATGAGRQGLQATRGYWLQTRELCCTMLCWWVFAEGFLGVLSKVAPCSRKTEVPCLRRVV